MKESRAGPPGKGSEAKENEGQVKLTFKGPWRMPTESLTAVMQCMTQ